MQKSSKLIAEAAILLIVLAGIGIYAYFETRALFLGPQIRITSPVDGSSFKKPSIIVAGYAYNVSYLFLDDNPIFVDTDNAFRETLLLLPGYNTVTVKALDRFGKRVEKTLELVYISPASTSTAASSTPS